MLSLLLINLMTATNLSLPIQIIYSFGIYRCCCCWILNPYCLYHLQKLRLEIVIDLLFFILHCHHESLMRVYCSCASIILGYLLINKMVVIYFWVVSMIAIIGCYNVEDWLLGVIYHPDDDNFNYYTKS